MVFGIKLVTLLYVKNFNLKNRISKKYRLAVFSVSIRN